jgi:hypothetical protein
MRVMKLIAIYNIFDGLELLEGSIRQIHDECSGILLLYQTLSNYGETDESIEPFVLRLAASLAGITVQKFEPELRLSGTRNETGKRTAGMATAVEMGATHVIHMDCDEYYRTDEFRKAKAVIEAMGYDSTACRMYTYFKDPTFRLMPMEQYYVPFISDARLSITDSYPVYADHTRTAMGKKFHAFGPDELLMHHFSWVRRDIEKKLRNSSARVNWESQIPAMVRNVLDFEPASPLLAFPGYTIEKVENRFDIRVDLATSRPQEVRG